MARETPDGTQVVTPSMFPETAAYVVAGAGDSTTAGRNNGPQFCFYADPKADALGNLSPQTSTLTWSFNDAIWMAGGTIFWDGALPGDTLSLQVQAPASTITPAPNGTGNVKLVPISAQANCIIPAKGDATHILNQPVPIPAWDMTPSMNPNGFWEYCDPGLAQGITTPDPNNSVGPVVGTGTVLPSSLPGAGSYMLLDVPTPLERFVARMPLQGSRTLRVTPQIKPKQCLPCYQFVATLTNSGHLGLRVSWVLEIGRTQTF